VRVVGDNVEQPLVLPIREALKLADSMELDLIEISPKAEPPVCRIADYQKFLYQQKKKAKELKANQVKVVIKEIRFGPQTDDHDYNFKLKHATNFLKEGCKVKAYVFFRGRSIVFKEQGEILLLRFATDLEEVAKVEMMPKLDGHNRGPGRESDCGFLFHDRRKRQRDGGLSYTCGSGPAGMHLRERAFGDGLRERASGTGFRERAFGNDAGDRLSEALRRKPPCRTYSVRRKGILPNFEIYLPLQ